MLATIQSITFCLLSKNIKIRIYKTIILPMVLGGCRKLHNEELRNLFSPPRIIRMIKSRRMRWPGHEGRMGEKRMYIGYWWEGQKERTTRKTKT
jgi:hypothetical protein